MVTVKNNKITMTRGDSLDIKIAIIKHRVSGILPNSKEVLASEDLPEGSQLKFSMSKFFPGMVNYECLLTKDIPTSTFVLLLSPEDTKNIPLGTYNYDVKLIANNKIDTFISSTIKLVGECEE